MGGALRGGRGDLQRSVHDGRGLVAALHFVVPLDHLAQHAGLVNISCDQ